MGLLAGFIGGVGTGMADVAKTTYKDMLENEKIDKQNAFTSQQTEKQNQFTLERDKTQASEKREALTFAITEANKYKEQYGQEAMRDVQQTGGKPVTEAGRQLKAQMEKDALAMDVGRSNINQNNASAGASEASANAHNSTTSLNNFKLTEAKLLSDLREARANATDPEEIKAIDAKLQIIDDPSHTKARNEIKDQEEIRGLLAQYQANKGNPEAQREIAKEIAVRGGKFSTDNYGTLDQFDDQGMKIGQVLYNKADGAIKNGGSDKSVPPAPPAAVEALKKNPKMAQDFKAKYGYLPAGF